MNRFSELVAPDSNKSGAKLNLAIGLGLTILVWAVFGQTLHHEFINFDDNKYVYENTQVSRGLTINGLVWVATHMHANLWHPLTSLTHMLDCTAYGLNAGGHHFTNVLLHNIAVVLLFLVLRQMTANAWASAFVAALFAVHPMRVESVAWIAERKDVLSAVFFMLTLGAYWRYMQKPGAGRYVLLAIAFACGLMSKAMLVTVPFVLLLLDYWPLGRIVSLRDVGRRLTEKIPLFALVAADIVITIVAQQPAINSLERLPLSERISNAFVSVVTYIEQMLWPAKLAVFYPHPHGQLSFARIAICIAVIAGITTGVVILGRHRRYLVTGWFWFLGMLVPIIGLVQAGLQGHADRFTYLPHIGLFMLATWGIADLTRQWRYRAVILTVGGTLVIVACASAAWKQTTYWRDSLTLWEHTLAVTTDNDTAELCMASALIERGRLPEAIPHSQAAVRIRVENAGAFGKVPVVLTNEQTREAIEHWQEVLQTHPEDVGAHNNLGVVYIQSGAAREAVEQWKASLQINPADGNAANNLAWVLATYPDDTIRDGPKAVELAERALYFPAGDNPMVLRTLAAAYAESRRFPEAIETATRAAEMAAQQQNPSLAEALRNEMKSYNAGKPHREASKPQ